MPGIAQDRETMTPWSLFLPIGAVASLLVWAAAVLHQLPWYAPGSVPEGALARANDVSLAAWVPEGVALSLACIATAWLVLRPSGGLSFGRAWAYGLLGGTGAALVSIVGLGAIGAPFAGVFPLVGLPCLLSRRLRAVASHGGWAFTAWCVGSIALTIGQEATRLLGVPGVLSRVDAAGVGSQGPGLFVLFSGHFVVAAASLGVVYGLRRNQAQPTEAGSVP
jgi:hypothetical protein